MFSMNWTAFDSLVNSLLVDLDRSSVSEGTRMEEGEKITVSDMMAGVFF